jgi:hypothetical protein
VRRTRDATGQMGLFTEDADSLVYVPQPKSVAPTQQLRGRDALAPVFDQLNVYATMHFNGQSTTVLAVRARRERL